MVTKKEGLILGAVLIIVLGLAQTVFAFGISPPSVRQEHLLRGSYFEKTIMLQTESTEEYKAEIEFSPSLLAIKDWISIDPGMEFTIPAGTETTKQFSLKIAVNVPQDAKLGEYQGYIWVSGKPAQQGQVTTATGGTIRVNLTVTDKEFSDWQLKDLGIKNMAEGAKTLEISLRIENLGNVEVRPSKVHLDIYDNYHSDLLSSGDYTELDWVLPFQTKEITAEFLADLKMGQQYWGDIEIYKGGELLLADERRFNVGVIPTTEVSPASTSGPAVGLEADAKLGFLKNKYLLFGLFGVIFVIGLGLGIRQIRKSKEI